MTTPVSDDQTVVQRILDHIDNRTTDLSDATWREPVENYRSEERFAAELDAVLRRSPDAVLPVGRAARGRVVRRARCGGTPILAVRGTDGRVALSATRCRHRGTQVRGGRRAARRRSSAAITAGPTASMARCAARAARATGSPVSTRARADSCRSRRSSDAASCSSRRTAGACRRTASWIELPELIPPSAPAARAPNRDRRAPPTGRSSSRASSRATTSAPTHRETFYPVQFDNLNVVEPFGRNSRIAFPYRRIDKLRAVPPAERSVDGDADLRLPPLPQRHGRDLPDQHRHGRARAARDRSDADRHVLVDGPPSAGPGRAGGAEGRR